MATDPVKKVTPIIKDEPESMAMPKKPVEVRNVSGRTLNLTMGQIDKNDIGWATPAEVGNLEPQYIVRI
jgi:hypothetical protein